MATLKILGINDEVTVCECCGRTNLKKTVALDDGSQVVRYGTECAARALKWSLSQTKRELARVEKEREGAEASRRAAEASRETARWESWLKTTCPAASSTSDAIRSLGGFKAAREAFRMA